jgi:SPW repeat
MIARPPRARRRDLLPTFAATVVTAITTAPWALDFSASHAAVAGHIAFAMAFGPIALLISALPAAAVTTAAAGAWLVASPWALGYASLGATAWSADLLAGLTLIALGVRARHVAHHDTGPSPRPRPPA